MACRERRCIAGDEKDTGDGAVGDTQRVEGKDVAEGTQGIEGIGDKEHAEEDVEEARNIEDAVDKADPAEDEKDSPVDALEEARLHEPR